MDERVLVVGGGPAGAAAVAALDARGAPLRWVSAGGPDHRPAVIEDAEGQRLAVPGASFRLDGAAWRVVWRRDMVSRLTPRRPERARLVGAEAAGGGLVVHLETDRGAESAAFGLVVDATGEDAALVRRLGRRVARPAPPLAAWEVILPEAHELPVGVGVVQGLDRLVLPLPGGGRWVRLVGSADPERVRAALHALGVADGPAVRLRPWVPARAEPAASRPLLAVGAALVVPPPLGIEAAAILTRLVPASLDALDDPGRSDALRRRTSALLRRWAPAGSPPDPAAAPPAPAAAPAPGGRAVGRRVELFIASGCNLHCYFCCESVRIRERRFLPWEEVVRRIDRAADEGVSVVQFMGGEATLHPRFPDALRHARERGLGTYVITNLLRWEDPAFAEAVAPHLDEVMISVHAWGEDAGAAVTGRSGWWARFRTAAERARDTLRARVRASTVLSRRSEPHLEAIADEVLRFRPEAWIVGAGVPIPEARLDVIAENLSLEHLFALRPRLEALSRRCREAGCRLVPFCIPHCALGPALWDDAHDLVVDHQDLSDEAPETVNFWSQADYLPAPRPVTLARSRPAACAGCARAAVCGGWFTEYFRRHGADALRPVPPTR